MKIGIDLGGTNMRIGQVVDGVIINKKIAPSPSAMEFKKSIAYFFEQLEECVTPDCYSIGIGVPSIVDIKNGIVYNVTNIPSWREVLLKEIVEDRFNIPVFVDNDANCFAMGESRCGLGRNLNNMIGLTLGTGVGAGVILNSHLYNGSNGGAGEIGDLPYLDGVFEDYCGSTFFTKYHNSTAMGICCEASKGEKWALSVWKEYGIHLGNLMKAILFTYDPEGIVVGGGISNAYPYFINSVYEVLKSFPYPKTIENLMVKRTENPDIAILGAASLDMSINNNRT